HLPGRAYREAARMCCAPMRMGLTATPERADGRHVDLDWLIGPTVYRQEISEARGRALAEYEVVRIPVYLSEEEQGKYERASRVVQSFFVKRQQELKEAAGEGQPPAKYGWRELCEESGKEPEARAAQNAFYFKRSIEDRAEEKLRVL